MENTNKYIIFANKSCAVHNRQTITVYPDVCTQELYFAKLINDMNPTNQPFAADKNVYDPGVGDKIRLGNSDLVIAIEKDLRSGTRCGNVNARKPTNNDIPLYFAQATQGNLDMVIRKVTVIDPILGIAKADIGIRNGIIAGIGKAHYRRHNPNDADEMIISPSTEVISGETLILTAGGIDGYVDGLTPEQAYEALHNGMTSFIGSNIDNDDNAFSYNSEMTPEEIARKITSFEKMPVNMGLLAQVDSGNKDKVAEMIHAGACGLKVHKRWGLTTESLTTALEEAGLHDVQVSIHTDTLNDCFQEGDPLEAIDGRTLHAYHTAGEGGGHTPTLLKMASQPNILLSSSNPEQPFDSSSKTEQIVHPSRDYYAFNTPYIQHEIEVDALSAENSLQDLGVLPLLSSDFSKNGNPGDCFMHAFQIATGMKKVAGKLPEDSVNNDNYRVLRYLAKVTINPAITFGIANIVGSIEKGKLADLVLWTPEGFGHRPKMVIKGGMICWSEMFDAQSDFCTPMPDFHRSVLAANGFIVPQTCVTFVSRAAFNMGIKEKLHLRRILHPVSNTRSINKQDMILNYGSTEVERLDKSVYNLIERF